MVGARAVGFRARVSSAAHTRLRAVSSSSPPAAAMYYANDRDDKTTTPHQNRSRVNAIRGEGGSSRRVLGTTPRHEYKQRLTHIMDYILLFRHLPRLGRACS